MLLLTLTGLSGVHAVTLAAEDRGAVDALGGGGSLHEEVVVVVGMYGDDNRGAIMVSFVSE